MTNLKQINNTRSLVNLCKDIVSFILYIKQ